MDLGALTRLIKSCDHTQLRDITVILLETLGYEDIALTDGRYDGGADFMAATDPGGKRRIPVQTSIEKDWKSKIKDDADKISESIDSDYLMFVSSRRLPTAEFETIKSEILEELGIVTTKQDAQSIASILDSYDRARDVLDIMNINMESIAENKITKKSFRSQAYASFTLFGKEPREFRQNVIESVIVSEVLDRDNCAERELVEEKAADILDLKNEDDISGAIDRMMMKGDLNYDKGALEIPEDKRNERIVNESVLSEERQNLRDRIKEYIEGISDNEITEDRLEDILNNLGSIIMEAARETAYSINKSISQDKVRRTDYVKESIDKIHVVLDEVGISRGEVREDAIETIGNVASNSPAGKRIFAGELYYLLTSMDTPQLVQALGGGRGIRIWLDASVAIPMLCGLLYEPVDLRYGLSIYDLYDTIVDQSIPLFIPDDYVKEIAYQMYVAHENYMPIVENFEDPDLKGSDNPFVSYYSVLSDKGADISFSKYLEGLGAHRSISRMEFDNALNVITNILKQSMGEYGIDSSKLYPEDYSNIAETERNLRGIMSSYNEERPDLVVQDDARTITYLNEVEPKSRINNILCTWDNIPQIYSKENRTLWEVFSPPDLSDILSLTYSRGGSGNINKPLQIAKRITKDAHDTGSKIWDTIVNIEEGDMHDAEFRNMARSFKEEYMNREDASANKDDITEAWSEWKADAESATDE